MPPEYINKLTQMFKDIKVSNDINDKFKNVARNNLNNSSLAGKAYLKLRSLKKRSLDFNSCWIIQVGEKKA